MIDQINERIKERTREIEEEVTQMDRTKAMTTVWEESRELVDLLESRPFSLQIAANIGLGKTTTTNIIGTFGGIKKVFEDVENRLLQQYYDDMLRYAERLQIDLINHRLYHILLNEIKNPGKSVIFDRTPYEDPLIFSKVLMESGAMSEESYQFCQDYFLMKKQQIETGFREVLGKKGLNPDLVILLTSSEERGWERVLSRKRDMEVREDAGKGVGLTPEFYHLLHTHYGNFDQELTKLYQGPVLRLGQDSLEVGDSSNSKGQLYTVKSVKEALRIINEK